MDYYLIDENKVRMYYENGIVRGNVTNEFELKNVKYSFDKNTLIIDYVYSSKEDSYVLTTSGFIRWKNIIRTVVYGTTYAEKLFNPKTNKESRDFIFCSNYICLGETPSNPIKKLKDYIIFVNIDNTEYVYDIKTAKELDIQIKENANELIIDFTESNSPFEKINYIGLEVNKIIYLFYHVYTGYEKVIIPKGTCFKTKHLTDNTTRYDYGQVVDQFYELCYE